MSEFSQALSVVSSGLKAQSARLRHVSENIANADTPGYHRKTVPFEETVEQGRRTGLVETGEVQLDRSDLKRIYDPAHPLADETGHYNGSNVDVMVEVADAREAQRSYEANLKVFEHTRKMSSSLMELLRK